MNGSLALTPARLSIRLLHIALLTTLALAVSVAHVVAMKRIDWYPRGRFSALYFTGVASALILLMYVTWTWRRDRNVKRLLVLAVIAAYASGCASSFAWSLAWRLAGGAAP
ncbi:MAG: hypothetical protein M3Q69_00660 [Acidobacteriota bacterium]|nr:hypothetical protein [Acidobacteriota bacterium]